MNTQPLQPLQLLQPPTVVRIRRKNNEIIQDCDVYIGRSWTMGGWNLSKSKWANPYPVKLFGREEALRRYDAYIRTHPELLEALPELAGKRLGCFCAPEPCHGNILVDLFNEYVN